MLEYSVFLLYFITLNGCQREPSLLTSLLLEYSVFLLYYIKWLSKRTVPIDILKRAPAILLFLAVPNLFNSICISYSFSPFSSIAVFVDGIAFSFLVCSKFCACTSALLNVVFKLFVYCLFIFKLNIPTKIISIIC